MTRWALALSALLCVSFVPPALADHAQPAPDITQMDYTPVGAFGPDGQRELALGFAGTPDGRVPATGRNTIPTPNPMTLAPVTGAYPTGLFNPSGKWVAYDSNVFTAMNFPDRHPDDPDENTEQDTGPYNPAGPEGGEGGTDIGPGGQTLYGACEPRPGFVSGDCGNHQREYGLYYEAAMKSILDPYGVQFKRYRFDSPGTGGSRGGYLDASDGKAVNIAAVVPGADHPEETVLVSGHYDFTDSGPDAGWDSIEGHQEVLRMAFIMADYWKKTGTRPSATIKFIPWDSEESGTFGSIDYVKNNVVPGEEDEVRGYFNVDPCAGAYPAYNRGVQTNRAPEILQLTNPENVENPAVRSRVEGFNARAETVIDDVFANLGNDATHDARLNSATTGNPGAEIFVGDAEAAADGPGGKQSQRDEIQTALGGLFLFSSDYRNFESIGVPIFNLFPDYFGPKADGSTRPGDSEGVGILHTPNDNLTTINELTSLDQAGGYSASEGWAEGMEMCAQISSWYMLQPQMGGAQRVAPDSNDVVAYFEALPNEAVRGQEVTFDAGGSYEYSQVLTRTVDPDLTYTWDFGDGTTGTGAVVQHAYPQIGKYPATLTVKSKTNPAKSDTMQVPITVIGANFRPPVLQAPPAEDPDGSFPLSYDYAKPNGFQTFVIEESRDYQTLFADDAEGDINAKWAPQAPTDARIEPWQKQTDEPNRFPTDNDHRSGSGSYWTGTTATPPRPTEVIKGESVLDFKGPIQLPARGSAQLQYFSVFTNEGDDNGFVEVALPDENDPTQPGEYAIVDQVNQLRSRDFYPGNTGTADGIESDFELRQVDLEPFAGKQVYLRFRYVLGDANRAVTQPAGWYIDDLRLGNGTFSEIGRTAENTFQVTDRPSGTFAYRVLAQFTGGVRTAASNVETVKVTRPPGGGTPGGGTPGGGTPGDGTPGGGTSGGGGPGAGIPGTQPGATRSLHVAARNVVIRGARGRARVVCRSSTRCFGTVRIRTAQRIRRGKSRRRILLVRRSVSVPAGTARLVSFRLSRPNARLVARRRSLRVRAQANLRRSTGANAARTVPRRTTSLKFLRPRRR